MIEQHRPWRFAQMVVYPICAVLLAAAAASGGCSSGGYFVSGFDENGWLTTELGPDSTAHAVAIQSDSKIVAAGSAYNEGHYDFAVLRYQPDGFPDTSFGNGGSVLTTFGSDVWGEAIVTDSEGRVVVAGGERLSPTQGVYLARYNADGSLDATFGEGGKVTTSIASGKSMTVGEDGKIVVVGDSGKDIWLLRYTTDGAPDISFGGNGAALVAQGHEFGPAIDVAIQPDGKVVVLAEVGDVIYGFDPMLVRCHPDGSLDAAFGEQGVVVTPRSERDLARANFQEWGLVLPDGTLVRSLNKRGEALAIQPDGRILVAGSITGGDSTDLLLIRYNPDGALDTSFGIDGQVYSDFGGGTDWGRDLTLLPDNKIVVAGDSDSEQQPSHFVLAQFHGDGSPNLAFGNSGQVSLVSSDRSVDIAFDLAVSQDGAVLVAGHRLRRIAGGAFMSDVILARYGLSASQTGSPP